MELKITDNNFEAEVKESSMPVLVDFYADWCGPYSGKCKIGKCNTDENPRLAGEYRVMSIPTFLFFKGGKVVDTVIGAVSKSELENKIKQVLA